ncbi:MAG: sulfatase-like hydrolase/transferase, partial [Pirellulales bacterium]|nr:sulfatase-like hydrolase/transferase [Pirellulales bacterium]
MGTELAIVIFAREIASQAFTKRLYLLLVVSAALGLSQNTASGAAPRPNIIHIFADDLGYGSVGFTGSQTILTPNLDALAGNGMVFNNAYAATLCAP